MTISTAGMIEAVRTAAGMTKTQEEKDCLNSIANRIEILTTANAGMDLELNSIRAALSIPVNTSVQAGVIAETSRLNDEVLSLRSELSESVALANKLRRTAKEHQEENQQLRTELAELRGQAPVAWRYFQETPTDGGYWVLHNDKPLCSGVSPLYANPAPPAASQHVPDERAAYEAFIAKRLGDRIDTQRAKNGDPENPDYMAWDMIVGWIAWQGRAAMLAAVSQVERKDGDA
ncbi:hypothetical protein [Pectobacterium carotovorum]|uniref:hypothetical protein n=1 Tax=Pectobacterium carotovorum TaxID=554 RepID=UPI0039A72DA5